MTLRVCSKCKKQKHQICFYKRKEGDGLHLKCKECMKETGRSNYQKKRLQYKITRHKWYERNKERVKIKTSRYAKLHRELYRVAYKKSYYKHRSKHLAYSISRRLHQKTRPMLIDEVLSRNILKYGQLTCALCLRPFMNENPSIDHVIPISKGGGTVLSNLQPAHKACNSAKHVMSVDEFRRRNGLLDYGS